jgi:hypothetical protein
MESDFLSLPALSRAIEPRDSAAIRGFYAEHAKTAIIERDHPPSRPRQIVGRPDRQSEDRAGLGRMSLQET